MNKNSTSSLEIPFDNYVDNDSALIAGVDEVGRGCLCGSVVASVVVIPLSKLAELDQMGITDSKKLTAKKREQLIPQIKDFVTDWQIAEIDSQTIDRINILQASLEAMRQAITNLAVTPDLCLIDGNKLIPNLSYPQVAVVKGDLRSSIIGAASILAKVWRDQQMIAYHQEYPMYDFKNNKGYGTKKHLEAIAKYGLTPQHRYSFSPCQLELIMNNE
jgi:ribonuclease HII